MARGPKGLKAAAAASALSLVRTQLAPGDSTDGAVFFKNGRRELGAGRLVAPPERWRRVSNSSPIKLRWIRRFRPTCPVWISRKRRAKCGRKPPGFAENRILGSQVREQALSCSRRRTGAPDTALALYRASLSKVFYPKRSVLSERTASIMRKLFLLTLVMLMPVAAFAGDAAPGEWRGHLMDTMCASNLLDKASSHTTECMKMPNCKGSGLRLGNEGRQITSSSMKPANTKALKELERSGKEDNLLVTVTGRMRGGVIRVASVTAQD